MKSVSQNKKFDLQQLISRFPVRVRILALCLVPLAGMLFVGYQQMSQQIEAGHEAAKTLQLAEKVPYISQVVHDLQIERGMSAGFVGSNGVKFAEELVEQRAATDVSINSLYAKTTPELLANLDEDVANELRVAMGGLDKLSSVRDQIYSNQISKLEMVKFYSQTIGELLQIIDLQIAHAGDAQIVNQLMALDALLGGKERAGIERAVGTGIFSAGDVDQEGYLKFSALVTAQEELLEAFKRMASPELVQVFEQTHAGPVVEKVEDLRKVLQGAPFGTSLASVSGERWFDATTDRINLLKIVDDAATADFVERIAAFERDVAAQLQLTLAVNAVILTITLVLAFLVVRSITGPIIRLTRTMDKISHGEFDTEIEGTQNHDELGEMARAVEIFRENGLKVAAMSEEEKAMAARNAAERSQMMSELQSAFGRVVDAAIAGDFSNRVDVEFPDTELNELAGSVNKLVETVDRGLSETGEVLGALANTDLTKRVEGQYQGAFERLKNDTNAVADKLNDVVGQLHETSSALKSATGEILAGANDLSERTTKQAATVEETSATMEQLSSTVLQSATQADDAAGKSQILAQTAEESGRVVGQTTEAMERITTSSAKISNIIGMIDDIAFQTNLLALNASVEAARAGEAGKGFAVVAVEVRRLAQSAAEASNEVKQLIDQSASEVDQGTKLVSSVAEKLKGMIESIQENSALMQEIANTSREQASSIEEINAAVRQMDEMTQHNAALVEETNAAIEQTDNQVNELDRVIDVFKLKEGASRRPAAAAAPSAPAGGDARALQGQVKSAAQTYLSQGSAAVDSEWDEF